MAAIPFYVIPSVDIRDGHCVRLFQGDFAREMRFGDDPVAVAMQWASYGPRWLHIVDLDGSRSGAPVHLHLLREMAAQSGVSIEFSGGLRTLGDMRAALAAGARRVALGTSALNPAFMTQAVEEFGDRVVVGIDVRHGRVATHGWEATSDVNPLELAADLAAMGVRRFNVTDIIRDGTLTAPNFALIEEVMARTGRPVICAGGVSSVAHLEQLRSLGAEGGIIGRALYSGDIDLTKALQLEQGEE